MKWHEVDSLEIIDMIEMNGTKRIYLNLSNSFNNFNHFK